MEANQDEVTVGDVTHNQGDRCDPASLGHIMPRVAHNHRRGEKQEKLSSRALRPPELRVNFCCFKLKESKTKTYKLGEAVLRSKGSYPSAVWSSLHQRLL